MFTFYEKNKGVLADIIARTLDRYEDLDAVKIIYINGVWNVLPRMAPVPVEAMVVFDGYVSDLRHAVEKNGLDEYVRMLLV